MRPPLRALNAVWQDEECDIARSLDAQDALLGALPALIEVVEQAERWGSLEEFNVDTLEHVPTPLGAALAALDAALGGERE